MYSTIATYDLMSIAMLDEDGIVVAWHERAHNLELAEPPIMNRHVSELYVAEDVAFGVPARDLADATSHGSSSQKGWRRGSDGSTFWAATVIKPLLRRDGTLQGYSYVTRRTPQPWNIERRPDETPSRTRGTRPA
jgi:hypothetical protein